MWSNNQSNWTGPVPIQGQNPNPNFTTQIPVPSDESRKRKTVEFNPIYCNSYPNPQSHFSFNIPPPIRPNNSNSFTFMQDNRPNCPNSFTFMQENRPSNPNSLSFMQENRPNNPNSFPSMQENRPNNPNFSTFMQENRPNSPNSLTFMQENRLNNPNFSTFMQENRPNISNPFTFIQQNRPPFIPPMLNGISIKNAPNFINNISENRPPSIPPILNGMNINNAPNFMNNISENRAPFISNAPFPSEIPKLNFTNEQITNISSTNPNNGYKEQFRSSNETQINTVQNFMNAINSMSGVSESGPSFSSEIPKLTNEKISSISNTNVPQNSTDCTSKISEGKLESEGNNGNNGKLNEGKLESDGNINGNNGKLKGVLMREKLWDGTIQLNTSTTVSVLAFFKSGDKNKDIVWPDSLEIKGKVRLQAFEKFIQELPRSRSRSLMVISLCWKITSSSSGLTGMKEVAKGYSKSEKVGFAEISPGLDLYICPRSDKIITILAKHGFFKGIMAIEEDQDSLIGCVVSRKNTKNQKPTNPNSSLSKTNTETKKDKDLNNEVISEIKPKSDSDTQEKIITASNDAKVKDLNPKRNNGDDDLPEFDFPVNHIPFTSKIPFDSKKDNDNDDDDMPEWSPPRFPPNVGTRPVPEFRTRYPPLSPKMSSENQSETSKSVPKIKENHSDNQKGILGPPPDRDSRFSQSNLKSSNLDVDSRKESYRWHRK